VGFNRFLLGANAGAANTDRGVVHHAVRTNGWGVSGSVLTLPVSWRPITGVWMTSSSVTLTVCRNGAPFRQHDAVFIRFVTHYPPFTAHFVPAYEAQRHLQHELHVWLCAHITAGHCVSPHLTEWCFSITQHQGTFVVWNLLPFFFTGSARPRISFDLFAGIRAVFYETRS
jgi:hypothetical protein